LLAQIGQVYTPGFAFLDFCDDNRGNRELPHDVSHHVKKPKLMQILKRDVLQMVS
jgi:hypothetical protein